MYEQAIRSIKSNSILGTLKLRLVKNLELELVQDVLDFDELVIHTSSGESHLVHVLDYDFYNYHDGFEIDLVINLNMDEDITLIADCMANYVITDENLVFDQIYIKDLTDNFFECKVIHAEIEWDNDSYFMG